MVSTTFFLTSILTVLTVLHGAGCIGQIYCNYQESCPKIQRIPYNIPPVEDPEGVHQFFQRLKSSIVGNSNPVLTILPPKNESEEEETSLLVIPSERSPILRRLERAYKALPNDVIFLSFLSCLLFCAVKPELLDYFMVILVILCISCY